MSDRNRNVMIPIVSFLAGLVVASTTHLLIGYGPQDSRSSAKASGERANDGRASGQPAKRVRSSRGSKPGAWGGVDDVEKTQLYARLFHYQHIDAGLGAFMEELTEEQARELSRLLAEFDHRLREHEAGAVRVTSRSGEAATLHVPALSRDGDERAQFERDLSEKIGEAAAAEFMRVFSEPLVRRFANWGQSDRSIKIDLLSDPPLVQESMHVRAEGTARVLTTFTEYDRDEERHEHLFDVLGD